MYHTYVYNIYILAKTTTVYQWTVYLRVFVPYQEQYKIHFCSRETTHIEELLLLIALLGQISHISKIILDIFYKNNYQNLAVLKNIPWITSSIADKNIKPIKLLINTEKHFIMQEKLKK
jgi:hypothetical protein